MLSAKAIREQVIRRTSTSPASGQRTLGIWCSVKSVVTTVTSLAARNSLHSPKYSSYTGYMILAAIEIG